MEKKYLWDRRTYSVKPEIVGKVFEELEEEFGEVTPDNFLEASTPEDSPTHKLFTWDDRKAAFLYRMNQSRKIINDLRIEIVANNDKMAVPAYVNVSMKNDGSASYRDVMRAFEARDTREIVLDRAYRELSMFKIKYSKFQELASIMDAIGEVLGDG